MNGNAFGALLQQAGQRLAAGDHVSAEPVLRRALALAPGQPDAMFMLGAALAMRGEHSEAIVAFDGALRGRPGFVQAVAQKARSLAALDRGDEALALAEQVGARAQDAYSLDTAGVVLTRAGLHDRAAQLYERAARAGGAPGYHYNHGMALVFLGRFDQARDALRQCLARDPSHGPAWAALVQITRQTREENETARLTDLARRSARDPLALHAIGHALAKAHEDLDDPAQAMVWLARAKAGMKRRYDPAMDAALFLEAERSVEGGGKSAVKGAPIFVVGLPRSGTTLTERILSSHSALKSGGELPELPAAVKSVSGIRSTRLATPDLVTAGRQVDAETVGRSYLARVEKRTGINERFVDKLPENVFFAPLILRALPEARVICLRRHPADTVLGNYRQAFAPDAADIDYAFDLEATARHVVRFEALVRSFEKLLPADRFMVVQYENIVRDLEGQARRMLDFCELEFEDACLRFHENASAVATASAEQVRRPINTDGIGRWRRYRPAIDSALDILVDAGVMDRAELD